MSKGFTLIELLVVIAIIGILASVVLVTFPGAQKKAMDSRTIAAMAQVRTVMTYYQANNNNSYAGFACTSPDMPTLCADIAGNSYGGAALNIVVVGTDNACISAPLHKANGTTFYCADATGVAKETAAACVALTATCP